MINNFKEKQKDNKQHIYKPRFISSQPVISGKKKGLGWLSWLGIAISVILTAASFVFTGPIAGIVVGVADAAAQIGISASQGGLSASDIAINSALAVLPFAQALRVSSKGAAAFSVVENRLLQEGKVIEDFTLSKKLDSHILDVGGSSIQITAKQSQALRTFAKLDPVASKVTYEGKNASSIIKVALGGDVASGALGKTTRQIFNPVQYENLFKLERTMDRYLLNSGAREVSDLSKSQLRILASELREETSLTQKEIGYFLREKLPTSKLENFSRKEINAMTFSERQKFLINRKYQKYRFGRLTKGVIDIKTGRVKYINTSLYYKFIQALHFLDPKLAARKILTKMQYYSKKSLKRWIRKREFSYIKTIENKWEKFLNFQGMKPFRKAIRQRMGIIIKEIESQMLYFPESEVVRGIRVIPILGNPELVNIIVFFKPNATYGKNPVVLASRPINEVSEWLASSSKMGYYLDNYALSRGGVKLGWAIKGTMGAMLEFLPISILRAHLSLSSNILKLGKMISEGKYGEEWKDIWKTFERLGPHKLGKFVFGRWGIALVRGFQKTSSKTGRTTFSFSNEFKWEPLQESLFRKTTSTSRSAQNKYQRTWRREQRYVEQYSRLYTQGASILGKSTRRKRGS